MPGSLFDTSVWIAAVFPTHPLHSLAREALLQATPSDPAVFCRATQQCFLRLLSTAAIAQAYGAEGLTNQDALVALDALLALPQVTEADEPPGAVAFWRQFAYRNTPSPKVWMDAYLAAFALAGGLRLVTLDRDFRAFEPSGLNLVLLTACDSPDARG